VFSDQQRQKPLDPRRDLEPIITVRLVEQSGLYATRWVGSKKIKSSNVSLQKSLRIKQESVIVIFS
jgi:hypothetical protein